MYLINATLLEQKGGFCLTAGRMGKYQVILLDNRNVKLQVTSALNPATLLPDLNDHLEYDCLDIVDLAYSDRPDLIDQALEHLDWKLFMNESSFTEREQPKPGYAVVTLGDN